MIFEGLDRAYLQEQGRNSSLGSVYSRPSPSQLAYPCSGYMCTKKAHCQNQGVDDSLRAVYWTPLICQNGMMGSFDTSGPLDSPMIPLTVLTHVPVIICG